MSLTAIQEEALNLPADDRLRLIDLLWESLPGPELASREAAWAAESERRIDAYESGELTARDAGEVLAELKRGLGR